jgi:hypothetical protein
MRCRDNTPAGRGGRILMNQIKHSNPFRRGESIKMKRYTTINTSIKLQRTLPQTINMASP